MVFGIEYRTALVGSLLAITVLAMSGPGAAAPTSAPQPVAGDVLTSPAEVSERLPSHGDGGGGHADKVREVGRAPVAPDGDAGEEAESGEDEAEEGASVIGDWWGLGNEANETPYLGLAEFGVVLLGLGLGGYTLGKRTGRLPPRYRRYLLPAHEWTMVVGTALTVPHFLAVDEWEGFGLLVGVLLGVEVLSGLYGRYLHRHVSRLGRGSEGSPILGRVIAISKATLFSRWRQVHVLLTLVTGLVLVLHIVTSLGE